MIGEFLDSPIRPEVKIPSISRRVAANLRRIFHRHQLRRTLSERQFLHVLDCHNGAGVPVSMEWENKPIIVVDERRLNFVFHVGRRAADLRPDIANPHRLAVLIFTLVSDLAGLRLPSPSSREIHLQLWELLDERLTYRINLSKLA